jgi:hypothetical protein
MKAAPTPLDPNALYLSPLGRVCVLLPQQGVQMPNSWATLLYCRPDGSRPSMGPGSPWANGFTLAPANFRILRRLT